MRINFAQRTRIQILVTLLLFTYCLIHLPARTQGQSGSGGGKVIMQDLHFIFGLGHGEKGRITVVNRDDSDPIHANLMVFGVAGNVLIEQATIIPPRAFRYMDVDPDEIRLREDERLQMAASVQLKKSDGGIWDTTLASKLPAVSGEIINTSNGQDSIWIDVGSPVMTAPDGRKYIFDGTSNTIAFGEGLVSFGLAPLQTARVSAFNRDPTQAIKITLRVWDLEGNRVAQRETIIPPGRLGYIDVAHEELDLIREPVTGRVQLALTVTLSLPVNPTGGSGLPPDGTSNTIFLTEKYASLEIVQEGKTVVSIGLGQRGGHVRAFSGVVADP